MKPMAAVSTNEIVRYMCQESLIAYLETNTSIAKDKIRQFVLSPEDGVADIPENKKPKLLTALEEVKICDPAIGSGAFPMGFSMNCCIIRVAHIVKLIDSYRST